MTALACQPQAHMQPTVFHKKGILKLAVVMVFKKHIFDVISFSGKSKYPGLPNHAVCHGSLDQDVQTAVFPPHNIVNPKMLHHHLLKNIPSGYLT